MNNLSLAIHSKNNISEKEKEKEKEQYEPATKENFQTIGIPFHYSKNEM